IAKSNKHQTAKEADSHCWIKYHTDTGNQTEQEAQNRHNREQRCSESKIFSCLPLFVPFTAEVEHTQTDTHPDHHHGEGCNTQQVGENGFWRKLFRQQTWHTTNHGHDYRNVRNTACIHS